MIIELIKWSYTKRYNIKAIFTAFPHSPVIFRQIKDYYFIYTVKWSSNDEVVTRKDLEVMETLLNRELGLETEYSRRIENRQLR